MSTSNRISRNEKVPEQELSTAFKTEMKRMRRQATFFVVGVLVLAASLPLLGTVPCIIQTELVDEVASCVSQNAKVVLIADPENLREISSLLLSIFVAMILAVVIMRPRGEVDQVPREAARGMLANLAHTTGLLTSIFALYWTFNLITQAVAMDRAGDVDILEIPLGLLITIFCALASTVLNPGLGVAVNNLHWAKRRIKALTHWESNYRESQTRTADWKLGASVLALTISFVATRVYWVELYGMEHISIIAVLIMTASIIFFFAFLLMMTHVSPESRWTTSIHNLLVTAFAIYLFVGFTSLVPVWPSAVCAIALSWFLKTTASVLSFASYVVPMPGFLSLKKTVQKDLQRYRRIVTDSQKHLIELSTSPGSTLDEKF